MRPVLEQNDEAKSQDYEQTEPKKAAQKRHVKTVTFALALSMAAKAGGSCKLWGARIYELPRVKRVGTEVAKRGRL